MGTTGYPHQIHPGHKTRAVPKSASPTLAFSGRQNPKFPNRRVTRYPCLHVATGHALGHLLLPSTTSPTVEPRDRVDRHEPRPLRLPEPPGVLRRHDYDDLAPPSEELTAWRSSDTPVLAHGKVPPNPRRAGRGKRSVRRGPPGIPPRARRRPPESTRFRVQGNCRSITGRGVPAETAARRPNPGSTEGPRRGGTHPHLPLPAPEHRAKNRPAPPSIRGNVEEAAKKADFIVQRASTLRQCRTRPFPRSARPGVLPALAGPSEDGGVDLYKKKQQTKQQNHKKIAPPSGWPLALRPGTRIPRSSVPSREQGFLHDPGSGRSAGRVRPCRRVGDLSDAEIPPACSPCATRQPVRIVYKEPLSSPFFGTRSPPPPRNLYYEQRVDQGLQAHAT